MTDKTLKFAIQHHAEQDLDELREFRGGELDIEPSPIRLLRKSNSTQRGRRVWRSRYGVIAVWVDDRAFRERLAAWMDRLRSEWQ